MPLLRPGHLLCFGFGYTARHLARQLGADWTFTGTGREAGAALATLQRKYRFDRTHALPEAAFDEPSHVLISIPPDDSGDPVFERHADDIAAMPELTWVGYLSTTGVYGDRQGGRVDETAELRPSGERGQRRVAAERAWLGLLTERGVPVHVFRLAGIYGPGRSPLDAVRAGTAKRIDKPGQVFSRVHVDDIAETLIASMARPRPGAVYNVCDDEPAPPQEVVTHAAALLGLPPPPLVSLEAAGLSPIARSFYADNKRVSNALIKSELDVVLRYPNYRAGLAAILAAGG